MSVILIINIVFIISLYLFPIYGVELLVLSSFSNFIFFLVDKYIKLKRFKFPGMTIVVDENGKIVRLGDDLLKSNLVKTNEIKIGKSFFSLELIGSIALGNIKSDFDKNIPNSNYNYIKTKFGYRDIYTYSADFRGRNYFIINFLLSKKENNPYFYWHFQSSPLSMVCFTLKGVVTYWNESSERMFGHKNNEVIGKSIVQVLNIDKDDFIDKCKICLKYHGSKNEKIYGKSKDGRILICEWNIAPIYNESNKVEALSAIISDITEKVYEYDYLEDLALRSTLIKDATSQIIKENNIESIFRDALSSLHSYAGWSAYSVKLYDKDHPTQFNTLNVWCANEEDEYKKFVENELSRPAVLDENFEGSAISLNLSKWVEELDKKEEFQFYFNEYGFKTAYFFPLNISGRPIGLLSMFSFESDLQDERIIDLVEKIFHQVVVSIDRLESNVAREESIKIIDKKMMQSNFLYSSLNIMLDTNYDISDVMSILVNMLMTSLSEPRFSCVKLTYEDKEYYSHEWSKPILELDSPLEVENAVVGNLLVGYKENPINNGKLGSDEIEIIKSLSSQISIYLSRIKTQKDLQNAIVDARQASQAKADFLAAMSHEIRTPMNGVVGMIDLLQYTNLDEEQNQMLSTVKNSAFSLLQIINDVLDFSKIEAGKLEIDNHDFDIYELLDDVGVIVSSAAISKKVRIYSKVESDVSRIMHGDSVRVRQVLFNLIGNAIKFSSDDDKLGEVHLYVKKEKGLVSFSIVDNGIGMSEKVLKKLFSPFTQAESDTTRKYGGTGLGLSICKQLCELMEGYIEVQSKEGTGSMFCVYLPILCQSDLFFETTQTVKNAPIALCITDATQNNIVKSYLHDFNIIHLNANSSDFEEASQYNIIIYDEALPNPLKEKLISKKGSAELLRLKYFEKSSDGGHELSANPLSKIQLFNKIESLLNHENKENQIRSKLSLPDKLLGTILIAEDNLTNQAVLRRQMALLGLDVTIANNGLEALNFYKDTEFDLILTDMHMPVLDGLGFTKAVRDIEAEHPDHPHIPILAITANVLENQQAEYLTKGIDEVVTKPVELEKLRGCLFKWLNMDNSNTSSTPELSTAPSNEDGEVEPTELLTGGSDNSDTVSVTSVIESNAEKSEANVINLQSLSEFVGDDASIQAEILKAFITPTLDNLNGILQAVDQQSMEEASELGHKLKSAARLVGAVDLAEACESLEKAGKEKNIEEARYLSSIIEQRVNDTVAYIEIFLMEFAD